MLVILDGGAKSTLSEELRAGTGEARDGRVRAAKMEEHIEARFCASAAGGRRICEDLGRLDRAQGVAGRF